MRLVIKIFEDLLRLICVLKIKCVETLTKIPQHFREFTWTLIRVITSMISRDHWNRCNDLTCSDSDTMNMWKMISLYYLFVIIEIYDKWDISFHVYSIEKNSTRWNYISFISRVSLPLSLSLHIPFSRGRYTTTSRIKKCT